MSGRKLARKACDACKIRKIKCTETAPCQGCKTANIQCTWLKQSQPRGPRRLREATLQEIRKAQDILQTQSREVIRQGTTRSVNVTDPDPPPEPSSEIGQLVLYLCVYRVQLYPIWPVIKVERLIASLQSQSPDVEVFALAYALAAATASRSESTELSISRRHHAQILEQRCQAARARVPPGRPPNLTTVRIAFFLHIYYESLDSSSMKSMLYLREAVTIATMIGLHKESYYLEVPVQERELRRRVLWLLFVTERVASVLYENTPSTLRTKIELPSTADTDEADVLAGFQSLVRLFWTLDDAGMFTVLDELDVQASPSPDTMMGSQAVHNEFSSAIQVGLPHKGYMPPVQVLGLAVTRAWLHVMNWRIQQAVGMDSANGVLASLLESAEISVEAMQNCSYALIEAHGLPLQLMLAIVSSALQELSTVHVEPDGMAGTIHRPAYLHETLNKAFTTKTGKIIGRGTSFPQSVRTRSDGGASIPSPTADTPSRHRNGFDAEPYGYNWSGQSNVPVQQRSPFGHDFAASDNYEGLFDAVDLAGVHSSDSVEDLFRNANLEHYSTFDEDWPLPASDALDIATGSHYGAPFTFEQV